MITISTNSYVTSSSYLLSFHDSSLFVFNTSINAAAGNYFINGNEIDQELSEAATEVLPKNRTVS